MKITYTKSGLRAVLMVLFLGAAGAGYLSVSTGEDGKVPPAELHRPTPIPDRILLTWSGDPARSQSVTWRTSVGVDSPLAQIAAAGDGPDFTRDAVKVEATSQLLESDLSRALYHTARFDGLEPDTMYAYRVGDGRNWSEWNQFRTAGAGADPLTFLYVGDAQNDIHEHWSRLIRMGFTKAPEADFILHAGDLVNRGSSDAEWGEWSRAAGWINRCIPSLPVPGNHEYNNDGNSGRALSRHWRPQFALPENGPPGLEESCYYVDVQGVRIVALNSNEQREEQARWLDAVLSGNPNRWTVLTFHHPLFSAARGRDNKALRERWQPIIDKHQVDLVLQGHDHTYARSNLISGVNTRAGEHGTVYVVSVSGPKMYHLERAGWMVRAAERTQLFQVVRIAGDRLSYEAWTARGLLYDAFELRKRPGKPNQLVNRVPRRPERVDDVSGE